MTVQRIEITTKYTADVDFGEVHPNLVQGIIKALSEGDINGFSEYDLLDGESEVLEITVTPKGGRKSS